ncbi:MAG: hypothetical protein KAT05_08830 [Spirochaetes bacterium]|nr:hypothetical protein [Spirochaetota bacterium]
MLIKISKNLKEEDFKKMKKSKDEKIIVDLEDVKYLSSKEITKLLILIDQFSKKIELINTNPHINETITILNLKDVIAISSEQLAVSN